MRLEDMSPIAKVDLTYKISISVAEAIAKHVDMEGTEDEVAFGIVGACMAAAAMYIVAKGYGLPDWEEMNEIGIEAFRVMAKRVEKAVNEGRIS